jgi:hypothetical protein
MLAEWAMVPDQRGVVGDRRTTSRRLRPLEAKAPAPTPIPLTTKKGSSATGEIATAKRKPTPAAANFLAVAPTVQVQLDANGVPVGEPLVPSDPSSFPSQRTPPPIRARGPSGRFAPLEDAPPARKVDPKNERTPLPVRTRGSGPRPSLEEALPFPKTEPRTEPKIELRSEPRSEPTPLPVRARSGSGRMPPLEDAPLPKNERTSDRTSERTPRPRRISSDGQTIAPDEFDAIESDFFAREADLYKREALETFDDLDPGAGLPGRRPPKK